jgi:hypothetical protein
MLSGFLHELESLNSKSSGHAHLVKFDQNPDFKWYSWNISRTIHLCLYINIPKYKDIGPTT